MTLRTQLGRLMVHLIHVLLVCLFLLGFQSTAFASLATERISISDGLPDSVVFSLAQDNRGYLWFGTTNGLSRYNGYEMKNFNSDPLSSNFLSNNSISHLQIDHQQRLWISTWGGGVNVMSLDGQIQLLLQQKESEANNISSNFVQVTLEDSQGYIWIGTATAGLDKYDPTTGKVTNYRTQDLYASSLSDNRIWSIVEDLKGNIWIGTSNGLNRFNPTEENFTNYYYNSKNPNSLTNNQVRSLHLIDQNRLLIGTQEGVSILNLNTEKFTSVEAPTEELAEITRSLTVNRFVKDPFLDTIWVLTDRGLFTIDEKTEQFAKLPFQNVYNNYQNTRLRSAVVDENGLLWIGTRNTGVIKVNPRASLFRTYGREVDVTAVLASNADIAWLGSYQGLFRGSLDDDSTLEPVLYKGKPIGNVFAIKQAATGEIFVATWRGLYRLNEDSWEAELELLPSTKQYEYRSLAFTKNFLWTGSTKGLIRYSLDTLKPKHVYPNGSPFQKVLKRDEILDQLFVDRNNVLWAGTKYGRLYRLQPNADGYEFYIEVGTSTIFTIEQAEGNGLWIGSTDGFFYLDLTTGVLEEKSEDRFTAKTVGSIMTDKKNNLWLATRNGLNLYDPKNSRLISISHVDGLVSADFYPSSYSKDKHGNLYFGAQEGLTILAPENIQISKAAPIVRQDEILVNHSTVIPTENTDGVQEITLAHTDKFLSIGFSLVDLSSVALNQYRYKLEGFDEDWVTWSKSRIATYTNLDPGTYHFKAQGLSRAGLISQKDYELIVNVLPPWWNTWWARLAGILLLTLAYTVVHMMRVRGLKQEQRALEQRVIDRTHELETLNQQLKEISSVDFLTQLINRRSFLDRTDIEISRAKRENTPICLALIDIDNFKIFNDVYGHKCGDMVLTFVAQHFRKNVRKEDIVGRWGGEEFIILMSNTSLEQGLIAFEKLRSSIAKQTYRYKDQALSITATFGVTLVNLDAPIDVSISEADKALYQGKRAGKNRVVAMEWSQDQESEATDNTTSKQDAEPESVNSSKENIWS